MKIRNIIKILITLIITIFTLSTMSYAGNNMPKSLAEDFVKGLDLNASESDQKKYINDYLKDHNMTLETLESLVESVSKNTYLIDIYNIKEKSKIILQRIDSIKQDEKNGSTSDDDDDKEDDDSGSKSGNSVGSTGGTTNGGTGFDEMKNQGDEFIQKGKNGTSITTKDAASKLLPVGRFLIGVGTIVMVIVGLIMGVKYMIAGANEKAQMKQKLIYYVISLVALYGAVGIFTIAVSVMNGLIA